MYNLFPTLCRPKAESRFCVAPKKYELILRTFNLWLFFHFLWYFFSFLLITLASFSFFFAFLYFSFSGSTRKKPKSTVKILHLCTKNINYAIKFLFCAIMKNYSLRSYRAPLRFLADEQRKIPQIVYVSTFFFSYARAPVSRRVVSFGFLFFFFIFLLRLRDGKS